MYNALKLSRYLRVTAPLPHLGQFTFLEKILGAYFRLQNFFL